MGEDHGRSDPSGTYEGPDHGRIRPWTAETAALQREQMAQVWAEGLALAGRELGPFFDGWGLSAAEEPSALLQLHPSVLRGDYGGFVGRDWLCPFVECCTLLNAPTVSRLHLQWLRLDRLPVEASRVLLGYRQGSIAVRDLTGGRTVLGTGEARADGGPGGDAWNIVRPGTVIKMGDLERTFLAQPRAGAEGSTLGQPTTAQMDVPQPVYLRVLWDGRQAQVAVSEIARRRTKPKVLPTRQAEVAYWLAIRARRFIAGQVDSPFVSVDFLRAEMFEDYDSDATKKLTRAIERLEHNLRTLLGVARPIAVGAGTYALTELLHGGCLIHDPAQGFADEAARLIFDG